MEPRSDINMTPLIDVLIVLLVVFLVISPVALHMETIEVPRRIDTACGSKGPDQWVILRVHSDLSMVLDDRGTDEPIQATELARTLRCKLAKQREMQIVYVDFAAHVHWGDVVATMDTIRSLAGDVDHDEIRVALATPSGTFERTDE